MMNLIYYTILLIIKNLHQLMKMIVCDNASEKLITQNNTCIYTTITMCLSIKIIITISSNCKRRVLKYTINNTRIVQFVSQGHDQAARSKAHRDARLLARRGEL